MGFNFNSAEDRNPIKSPEVQELEHEIALLNEFLELVGRAHIYDMWKYQKTNGEVTIDVADWEPKIQENNGDN
jgi:hypothetical protein